MLIYFSAIGENEYISEFIIHSDPKLKHLSGW